MITFLELFHAVLAVCSYSFIIQTMYYGTLLMLTEVVLFEERESSSEMGLSLPRILLVIAVILFVLLSVVCHVIALITSYWLQSSTQRRNSFLNIGLWRACFDHYKHKHKGDEDEDEYNVEDEDEYDGCHDLYSDKYVEIRDWLVPGKIAVYFTSLSSVRIVLHSVLLFRVDIIFVLKNGKELPT